MSRTLDTQTALKPAYFAHFVLRVRNLEKSLAWYQTAVSMEVVNRSGPIAFLTFDEEHHRLALLQTPVQEPAPPGADHVAYTFNELGDLLSHYVRLKNEGIKPVWTINHGPTTSMYYEDPDGNRVEFQVDNFETEAELKGWMNSEETLKLQDDNQAKQLGSDSHSTSVVGSHADNPGEDGSN